MDMGASTRPPRPAEGAPPAQPKCDLLRVVPCRGAETLAELGPDQACSSVHSVVPCGQT